MHTYLPEEQKKTLRTEYILRLIITSMLVGTVVVGVGIIGMLPAYIDARLDLKDKEYQLSDEGQKKLVSEIKEIEQQVKYATDFSNKFLEGTNNPTLIQALSIPTDSIVKGIKLTSFELSSTASSSIDLRVGGTSVSRETLIVFRKNIEGYTGVQKVELPVSDLAKSKDLTFVMRVQAN